MKYDTTNPKVIERLATLQELADARQILTERAKAAVQSIREDIKALDAASSAIKYNIDRADQMEMDLQVDDLSLEVLNILKSCQ